MAKKKISDLPAGSALTGVELVPIVQSGTTKRITAQDIADLSNASSIGGGGTSNYVSKFTTEFNIGDSQIFDNGTSVGIATDTPSASYKLDIVGSVRATTIVKSGGTSSEYLKADGSVSTLTNPITGTGTTNYLPKFTGASALGNSSIFDNGTSVGIGTASFAGDELLMVSMNGTTNSQAINVKDRNASGNASTFMVFRKSDDTFLGNIRRSGTSDALFIGGNSFLALGHSGNTEAMRITSAGSVGIGTTSPGHKLEVIGNGVFSAAKIGSWSLSSGFARFGHSSYDGGSSFGFMQNPSGDTYVNGTICYYSGTKHQFEGGPVLVNTTTDAGYKLDVNGTARVSGMTTIVSGIGTGLNFKFSSGYGNSIIGFNYDSGSDSGNSMYFGVNNAAGSPVTALTLNGLGAATFSSSVTATQGTFKANNVFNQDGDGQISIRGASTPEKTLLIGFDTTSNYGYLQSIWQGNSSKPLVLQPFAGSVGIGTATPDASAKVQIDSTTQGFLVPRMLESEINAISSPAEGLLVYNTDQNHMCMYDGSGWKKFSMSNM